MKIKSPYWGNLWSLWVTQRSHPVTDASSTFILLWNPTISDVSNHNIREKLSQVVKPQTASSSSQKLWPLIRTCRLTQPLWSLLFNPDGESCSPTPETTPRCAPQSWAGLPGWAVSSANAASKWSRCPSTAWRITTAGPRWEGSLFSLF